MVTATNPARLKRTARRRPTVARYDYVSPRRGAAILDREARRYLNMSGAQFRAAYRAGTIEDPDRSEVVRVAMLLPLADD